MTWNLTPGPFFQYSWIDQTILQPSHVLTITGSPDRDPIRTRSTRSAWVFRPPSPVRRSLRPSPPRRQQNNQFGRRRSVRDDDSFGDRSSGTWRGYGPSPPRRNTGRTQGYRGFDSYLSDDGTIRLPRTPDSRASGGWSGYYQPTGSSRYVGYW